MINCSKIANKGQDRRKVLNYGGTSDFEKDGFTPNVYRTSEDWKVSFINENIKSRVCLIFECKVRIFWEGHKIWKNLPLKIWRYWLASNFKWKIFSNFVAFSEYPNFKRATGHATTFGCLRRNLMCSILLLNAQVNWCQALKLKSFRSEFINCLGA